MDYPRCGKKISGYECQNCKLNLQTDEFVSIDRPEGKGILCTAEYVNGNAIEKEVNDMWLTDIPKRWDDNVRAAVEYILFWEKQEEGEKEKAKEALGDGTFGISMLITLPFIEEEKNKKRLLKFVKDEKKHTQIGVFSLPSTDGKKILETMEQFLISREYAQALEQLNLFEEMFPDSELLAEYALLLGDMAEIEKPLIAFQAYLRAANKGDARAKILLEYLYEASNCVSDVYPLLDEKSGLIVDRGRLYPLENRSKLEVPQEINQYFNVIRSTDDDAGMYKVIEELLLHEREHTALLQLEKMEMKYKDQKTASESEYLKKAYALIGSKLEKIDPAQAFRLYFDGAVSGDERAMLLTGQVFEGYGKNAELNGRGRDRAERGLKEALWWYDKARKLGNSYAEKRYQDLLEYMQ